MGCNGKDNDKKGKKAGIAKRFCNAMATALVGISGLVYGMYQLVTRVRNAINSWNSRMQQVQRARLTQSLQRFQQACDESVRNLQANRLLEELENDGYDEDDCLFVSEPAFRSSVQSS